MILFYKTWKKCNEIQLTKNEMYLNNLKQTEINNHEIEINN